MTIRKSIIFLLNSGMPSRRGLKPKRKVHDIHHSMPFGLRQWRSVNLLYSYWTAECHHVEGWSPNEKCTIFTILCHSAYGNVITIATYRYTSHQFTGNSSCVAAVRDINLPEPPSSSSSCRATSTDIPDPLSPLFPIVHRLRLVFRATSRILT